MDDGSPWIAILVTIVLIALNGMLASAEIAMMNLNEVRLKEQAHAGDKKAKLLLNMKKNPSNFLSTIQIGITLAGLLSGAFAADSLATPIVAAIAAAGVSGTLLTVLRVAVTFFITLLMTFAMLVFGELVPKRIAMVRPEKTARGSVSVINGLAKVTKPLVKLLAVTTNGVLKLVGVNPDEEGSAVTEADILLMMREGQIAGEIEPQELQILSNLFEFTDLQAGDAMTHRTEIEFLNSDASVEDIISAISETGYSKFPVIEGSADKVVGVLYSSDVLKQYSDREQLLNKTAADLMRAPYFVYEHKALDEVFTEMKISGAKLAVVADEYGGTSGILTMLDIIEEIVGDIEVSEEVLLMDDGSYLADGRIDFEDLEILLDMPAGGELDDDDRETLSGFIINRLGYVPTADDSPKIYYKGFSFTVKSMKGALVESVVIERINSEDSAE